MFIDTSYMRSTSLSRCRLVDVPVIRDADGMLSVVESRHQVPFEIQRIFYIRDVPASGSRGDHALRTCEQFIVAIAGTFDVVTDDGRVTARWSIDQSSSGLYVPAMVWRRVENFSPGAICLVLASELFDEGGYIFSYEAFKAATRAVSS
jgi:hypothetical protein